MTSPDGTRSIERKPVDPTGTESTMHPGLPGQRSLRQRLFAAGVAMSASAILALLVLAALGETEQRALKDLSGRIIEEQRIGNEIIRGVMQQITIASDPASKRTSERLAAFDSLSSDIYSGLRSYLFRDMGAEERMQIESVKEEHQRMEVAARRAMSARDPSAATAVAASEEMMRHAYALLEDLHGFTDLREQALDNMAESQRTGLNRLMVVTFSVASTVFLAQLLLTMRFIRRRVTQPLFELEKAVTRAGAGDLGVRMPTATDREFAATFSAFNGMALNLARSQSALESRNTELTVALDQVREAQDELIQSEKLGAIGRMTAGLAHELNNPLTTVLTTSELLSARLADDEPLETEELRTDYVEPILKEADRARLLIRSLLQFARRSASTVGPVPLRDSVAMVRELRQFSFSSAGIALDIGEMPDISVIAERQQFQVVLLNIMNNAIDAMKSAKGGKVTMRSAVDNDWVKLTIEDNGPGIRDPERVFEAFYTTKGIGEGTGLGLALAERFMTAFGGSISARNRAEGGACFTLKFRIADKQADATADSREASPAIGVPASGGKRVLAVDDEPAIQKALSLLLRKIGIEAVTCSSVEEARRLIDSGGIDGVICDVKMPGENGTILFEWVRAKHPELLSHFVFVTGDTDTPELLAIEHSHDIRLVSKPFAAQEFSDAVLEMLARQGSLTKLPS